MALASGSAAVSRYVAIFLMFISSDSQIHLGSPELVRGPLLPYVLLVRRDPIGGDVVLRRFQVHLVGEHVVMQCVLQLVLQVGVPIAGVAPLGATDSGSNWSCPSPG